MPWSARRKCSWCRTLFKRSWIRLGNAHPNFCFYAEERTREPFNKVELSWTKYHQTKHSWRCQSPTKRQELQANRIRVKISGVRILLPWQIGGLHLAGLEGPSSWTSALMELQSFYRWVGSMFGYPVPKILLSIWLNFWVPSFGTIYLESRIPVTTRILKHFW